MLGWLLLAARATFADPVKCHSPLLLLLLLLHVALLSFEVTYPFLALAVAAAPLPIGDGCLPCGLVVRLLLCGCLFLLAINSSIFGCRLLTLLLIKCAVCFLLLGNKNKNKIKTTKKKQVSEFPIRI